MGAARYNTIAGSTRLDDRSLILFDGQPLLHRFGAFLEILDERAGEAAARLFALPDTNISRQTGAPVTTWYAAREGRAQPLDEAPADIRQSARETVDALVAQLRQHPDPELRAMAVAALEHFSPDMIVLVGEDPVLIDWGLLPPGMEAAASTPPAPGLAAGIPVAPLAAPAAPADPTDGDPAPPASEPAGHAPSPPPPPPPPSVAVIEQERANPWAMGSLLALAVFLAVALLYVLWPGNLVFPNARHGLLDETAQAAVEASAISALEEQIGRYRIALAGDLCVPEADPVLDGLVGLPFNAGQPPAVVPDPIAGSAPAGTDPGQPAAPSDATAPESGPPVASISSSSLLDRLDEIAVLVIARSPGSTSTGSGFLVAPDMVLTNYHVVEEMTGGDLMVASTKLGRYIPATLVARTQTSDIGGVDFALLKLAQPSPFAPAELSPAISRLDPVIAAGYPAFVVETDPSFIAGVQQGDLSQLDRVQMAVTQGVVMTAQSGINNTQVIAHSATISSGNSGGPLVDMCGRVVGVNTFARADAENALRNNYALGATDAHAFLKANGVEPAYDPAACAYAPAPATARAAEAASGEPEPAQPAADAPVEPAIAPSAEPAIAPAAEPDPDAPDAPPAAEPPAEPADGDPATAADDPAESPDLLTVP